MNRRSIDDGDAVHWSHDDRPRTTSVAGLVDARVYGEVTENRALQAKGQDWGNLLAVVALVVAALRQRMGSPRAALVRLGTALYLTTLPRS